MDYDSMIEVIEAAKVGKAIQRRVRPARPGTEDIRSNRPNPWVPNPQDGPCSFNFAVYEYRVKPEPKEYWIVKAPMWESGDSFESKKDAEVYRGPNVEWSITHVQEVE